MRIPRGISGKELARALDVFGYRITRQTGSHLRLTTLQGGEHHITIPLHDPLRVGTLAAVLALIGDHFHLSREQVIVTLFGDDSGIHHAG